MVTPWYVYVIQSSASGFFYVGCTTDPIRRIKQHNGLLAGGGKYTAKHRPWQPRALFGVYEGRSDAQKAEYTLKRSKRGIRRAQWNPGDSVRCRILPLDDPTVEGFLGYV